MTAWRLRLLLTLACLLSSLGCLSLGCLSLGCLSLGCLPAGGDAKKNAADAPEAKRATGADSTGARKLQQWPTRIKAPAAKHGQGEFRYVDGVPVLTLAGGPEEMGEQAAVLLARHVKGVFQIPRQVIRQFRAGGAWPVFVGTGRLMLLRTPKSHQQEINALVKHSGIDRGAVAVANTLLELRRFGGCSTLAVEPARSKTGGMLLGRNFDFPPIAGMEEYSLVTVVRGRGKKAFVSVGFPGLCGVISGMNEDGLALACLDVYESKDQSLFFDPTGAPMMFSFRRVLEECRTVDEAERVLKSMKATTWMNLAVCDARQAAVFEITPASVVRRKASAGILPCTNHFRTPELGVSDGGDRYATLLRETAGDGKLGTAEVAALLHDVNQGKMTVQSMIFEPAKLRLYLSAGPGPTSAKPMRRLDLANWLKPRS